jgi:hypothetical protein
MDGHPARNGLQPGTILNREWNGTLQMRVTDSKTPFFVPLLALDRDSTLLASESLAGTRFGSAAHGVAPAKQTNGRAGCVPVGQVGPYIGYMHHHGDWVRRTRRALSGCLIASAADGQRASDYIGLKTFFGGEKPSPPPKRPLPSQTRTLVSTLHHRLTKAPRCLERKSVDRCVVEFVCNAFHHDRDSAGRYVDLLRRAFPKKRWENVS